VREDPEREGLLYAGTEYGLYISFDDGAHWQSLQQNLPVTPVTDIKVHQDDLALSTMGRGFWIMDDLGPLRQLTDRVAAAEFHFFQPADAYRMRYSSFDRAPADPEYRPIGVFVDYYLSEEVDGDMALEIVAADGAVIRRFASGEGDAEADEQVEPGMGWVPLPAGAGDRRLPDGPGMHRFVWDLRHPGPWSENGERGDRGAPLAAPGSYEARLSVGGETVSRTFQILIDPRVEVDGVTASDLIAQEELNLRIRDALSVARRAAQRIDDLRQVLEERTGDSDGDAPGAEELKALHEALVSDGSIQYPQRMLIDQIQYLYGMTTSADQRPGADAYERIETLEAELEEITIQLQRLVETGRADVEEGR
jgi:hypothetical protein